MPWNEDGLICIFDEHNGLNITICWDLRVFSRDVFGPVTINSGVVSLLTWLIWAAVNTAIKFGRGSKQPDNENNRTICLRMNSGAVRLGHGRELTWIWPRCSEHCASLKRTSLLSPQRCALLLLLHYYNHSMCSICVPVSCPRAERRLCKTWSNTLFTRRCLEVLSKGAILLDYPCILAFWITWHMLEEIKLSVLARFVTFWHFARVKSNRAKGVNEPSLPSRQVIGTKVN